MNKIALVAAAILVATGSAFAGSDHYDSKNVSPSVDHAVTCSVKTMDMVDHKAADTRITTTTDWPESGQGIWGN
jgi:hypothetical protein